MWSICGRSFQNVLLELVSSRERHTKLCSWAWNTPSNVTFWVEESIDKHACSHNGAFSLQNREIILVKFIHHCLMGTFEPISFTSTIIPCNIMRKQIWNIRSITRNKTNWDIKSSIIKHGKPVGCEVINYRGQNHTGLSILRRKQKIMKTRIKNHDSNEPLIDTKLRKFCRKRSSKMLKVKFKEV